jgi:dolichyl-phosphate beta-glucosyltransferase
LGIQIRKEVASKLWLKGDKAMEPTECDLSLVVPAYKETERLPVMMQETLRYLQGRIKQDPTFTYEIIVVDDGSADGTTECALKFSEEHGVELVRVLRLARNRGKGGAVKMGVLSSRGKRVLMVDADAATEIKDLSKLETMLDRIETDGLGIVCGSRAHLEDDAKASRSFFRTVLMHGFHTLVSSLCVKGVRDTQCGFKLFTRKSAMATFMSLHLDRWAFDVELLYIAQQLAIPIGEVAVNWQEIDGSKLSPLEAALQMGRDLIRINLLYSLKLWEISETTHRLMVQPAACDNGA